MPPRAAELSVSDYVQAAGALLLNYMANRIVFHSAELPGVNLTAGELQSRLLNRVGT
ncbi:hypothetical protein D3C71_1689220 [compost metagenome]